MAELARACSPRMALRFARGSYAALALTVVAIACGVALVCAIDLANRAVLRAFVEVVDTMAGRAALQVVSGEGGLFSEDVAGTVAEIPGVELTVPVVRGTAFVADEAGEPVAVQAMDLTGDAVGQIYGALGRATFHLDDPLVFLSHPDSIALTHTFADRRRLALGDRIELMTPTGLRDFTVRGLLEPEGLARAYGGNLALMDLYAAAPVFAAPGLINAVDVVVARGADVGRVARDIARTLPPGLQVETPAQRQADLHKVMQSLPTTLRAMGMFCLVVGFLISFNRLSTVFDARAWQLGVLRAVGVRGRVLGLELLKESLLFGAAGVALGIPLGIGLGRLLVPVIASTTELAYGLVAPEASLAVSASSIVLAAGLGLGTTVLAAALPARRASQVEPAAVIRCRGAARPECGGRSMWALRGATAAGVATAVAMQAVTRSATWGLVATGLLALGTALGARPLLHLVGAGLFGGRGRLGGPIVRFATANLVHNPRRTALTVATVGAGLGCVIWFWTVATSFQSSLNSILSAAVRADLVITSAHVVAGAVDAPLSEDVIAEIARVPGVATVAGSRMIHWPHAGQRIAIEAIDPAYLRSLDGGDGLLFGERIPDAWERVARGEAAIVSSNFLLNFGARVGDPIVLDTPSGPLELRIGGVTAALESPAGTVQISRELYRVRWRDRNVSRVAVRGASGMTIVALRDAIARDLARPYDLRILSAGELVAYYATQVARGFAPLRVLASMVLLVTLLGVADTLAAGVLERTRQLGALRALGVPRRRVARIVLVEGLLLGGLGLVLALMAGLALAAVWIKGTLPSVLGWTLDLHVPYRGVPLVGALTLAVCLIAAFLPARRAARLQPQVALRYE